MVEVKTKIQLVPQIQSLTMKFWRLMGFMMTGGPAVRGQAWSLASVACCHSLSVAVLQTVPVFQRKKQFQIQTYNLSTGKPTGISCKMALTSKDLLVRNKRVADIGNAEGSDQRSDNVFRRHCCCTTPKQDTYCQVQ
jgi:hypothetical protein